MTSLALRCLNIVSNSSLKSNTNRSTDGGAKESSRYRLIDSSRSVQRLARRDAAVLHSHNYTVPVKFELYELYYHLNFMNV